MTLAWYIYIQLSQLTLSAQSLKFIREDQMVLWVEEEATAHAEYSKKKCKCNLFTHVTRRSLELVIKCTCMRSNYNIDIMTLHIFSFSFDEWKLNKELKPQLSGIFQSKTM